ncbi:LPS export ABC transporter periplasmic protein LptC [Lysobacter xanthus]
MNWRVVLGIVLAVAAVAIGTSLWQQSRDDIAPLEAGRSDYTLHDFELVSLDATGRESFTLRAPKLTRDPDVRTLTIATPLFVIPPKAAGDGNPWNVRSRTGWVSAAGDEIRLRGDVLATSTNAQGGAVSMTTQQLNVFPDAKRASSPVATRVQQPGLILSGHGMEARLDTQRVTMKDAKARYVRSN